MRAFPPNPTPLPAILLAPFFAWSLSLVPRPLLRNRTETLATQANAIQTQPPLLLLNQEEDKKRLSSLKDNKHSKGVFLSVNPKMDFRSKNGFRVPFGKSKSGFLIW